MCKCYTYCSVRAKVGIYSRCRSVLQSVLWSASTFSSTQPSSCLRHSHSEEHESFSPPGDFCSDGLKAEPVQQQRQHRQQQRSFSLWATTRGGVLDECAGQCGICGRGYVSSILVYGCGICEKGYVSSILVYGCGGWLDICTTDFCRGFRHDHGNVVTGCIWRWTRCCSDRSNGSPLNLIGNRVKHHLI